MGAGPGAPGDGSIRIGQVGALPPGGEIGQIVVNTGPGSGAWTDPPAIVSFVARGGDVAYSAADQTLSITSSLLPPVQLSAVGSVLRLVWPGAIARNRVDPIQVALPDDTNLMKNGDGSAVVPSMVTPSALAEMVLLYVNGAYEWRLLGQLAQRPQDYPIYTGWADAGGLDTFTAVNFTYFSTTPGVTQLTALPGPAADGYRYLFAVPTDTGDMNYFATAPNGGNQFNALEVSNTTVMLNSAEYKVWIGRAPSSGRLVNIDLGIGQDYP